MHITHVGSATFTYVSFEAGVDTTQHPRFWLFLSLGHGPPTCIWRLKLYLWQEITKFVGLDSVTVSAVVLWSGGNFWPQVRILLLPNFLGKSLGNGWLNTTGPGLLHGDLINVGAVYQVSEMSRHLGTLKIPRRATIEKSRVWYPLPSDIEPSLEHWRDTRKRCCQLT